MSVWDKTKWWRTGMYWGLTAAAVSAEFDSVLAGLVVVVYGWLSIQQ